MNGALYVAKTGLTAQDQRLQIISNNLANVSTTGFKKDRAVFNDLFYRVVKQPGAQSSQDSQLPSGLQLGHGVSVAASQKLHTAGALELTENPLDLAIDGRGFFQVLLPDGTTAYTRDGQFQINSDGLLVNASGFEVQPSITIPSDVQTLTVGQDGTVSVTQPGTVSVTQLGIIQVADFVNPAGLQALGDNNFRETAASGSATVGTAGTSGLGLIRGGMVENSNVNVVEEMVSMIETQRAYEMNSKVISTADQMLQFIAQNL